MLQHRKYSFLLKQIGWPIEKVKQQRQTSLEVKAKALAEGRGRRARSELDEK